MKVTHPNESATNSKQRKARCMKETSTWFMVSTYITEEMLKSFAEKEYDRIRYMSAMYHDKDIKEDGTLKKPHYHVVLNTTTSVSLSAMQGRWDSCMFQDEKGDIECFCEVTHNAQGAEDYQEHKYNPEKHQYPKENRLVLVGDPMTVANSRPKDKTPKEPKKDNCFEILEQLANGVSKWTLAQKYGRDFILNFSRYQALLSSLNGFECVQAYERVTDEEEARKIYFDRKSKLIEKEIQDNEEDRQYWISQGLDLDGLHMIATNQPMEIQRYNSIVNALFKRNKNV